MKKYRTSWQSLPVGDGPSMNLFVARPRSPSGVTPCVIVLQEAFGVNAHIQDVALRVASLGYVAVAPELFHRTAPGFIGDYNDLGKSLPLMQALTNDQLEADLQATHHWLREDTQADTGHMAALGFCFGGKAAFIAGAVLPLKAAISYYGSGITGLLQDYTSRQHAPLLLFWGGKDRHTDAAKRNDVAEALHEADKIFTQVEFSHAGHGFFCEARKTYAPETALESWAMLSMFLQNHVKHG